MPSNNYIAGTNVAPPFFKLVARYVKSCRRYQMVEDDCVMFPPIENRNCIQVIIIKEVSRDATALVKLDEDYRQTEAQLTILYEQWEKTAAQG